jgi:hypothetical protein
MTVGYRRKGCGRLLLPPRIVGVEVQAPERLPAAMVTAFDVAARAMALADGRAAIRTGSSEPGFRSRVVLASVARRSLLGCTDET